MLIVYEKEEGFFEKLKKMTDKTKIKIFVSRAKKLSENGIVTPTIVVQAVDGDDVYMIEYTGDMQKFRLISSFENILNPVAREQVQKDYNQSYIAFQQSIEEEYNKMFNMLKTAGFSDIENALIA